MPQITGVLVMGYGTPAGPEDVERYYTDIRRGRAPSAHALAELRRRYEAIGNTFPLAGITRRQVEGLQKALDARSEGSFLVGLGQKHSAPFIGEGARGLADAGVERVVGLVLAPHYSRLSVGDYADGASAALGDGPPLTMIEWWYDHPQFLDLLSTRVRSALEAGDEPDATVIFTAHSLPQRILEWNDPYPQQLARTAELVAGRLHLERFVTAWQSAGRTPEPWLGPNLGETIADLASKGTRSVVVCPCGFVADHLEILWDIDIDAKGIAERAGVRLARTESMNDDPAFMDALAAVVLDRS